MSILEVNLSLDENSFFNEIKRNIFNKIDLNNHELESLAKNISKEFLNNTPHLVEKIQKLKNDLNVDVVSVTNIPEFKNTLADINCAKVISFSLSLLLGEPFQYLQQNNGEVIAEIKPTDGLENSNSSGGKIDFGWHTDDCFLNHQFRTKWIQLTGFYNPDNTLTGIALIEDIVKLLTEKALNKLMTKNFKVGLPASFSLGKTWSIPTSLIRINKNNQFEIGVPTYNVLPIQSNDKEATDSLSELVSAANQCRKPFNIKSGNLLIFNNDRLLHGRDAIKTSRTVLRTYIRPNLYELQSATNSNGRVFDLTKLIKL